jgi:ketosteroid isomerase-like protein
MLDADEQIALVETYFRAVDAEDMDGVLSTLADDCTFTVETHGVRLQGHTAIAAMFERLWTSHKAVRHYDFTHIPNPRTERIASQFKVQNTELDGGLTHKSNCNFFDVKDGCFAKVAVYMTGANPLNAEQAKD